MPIGKNAIKRVTNNGYSNVNSNAPDMENSTAVDEKIEEAPKVEQTVATEVKQEPKKPAQKKTPQKKPAPKKSMEAEPELSPVKTAKKITKKAKATQKRECDYYAIGEELPIYLL